MEGERLKTKYRDSMLQVCGQFLRGLEVPSILSSELRSLKWIRLLKVSVWAIMQHGRSKGSMVNTLKNHTVLHKGGNPFHQQLLSSWDRSSLVLRPCDGMSLLLVCELLVVQSVVSCDVWCLTFCFVFGFVYFNKIVMENHTSLILIALSSLPFSFYDNFNKNLVRGSARTSN